MTYAAAGLWISMVEDAPSSDNSGTIILWVFLLIGAGLIIWWAHTVSLRRGEADAYLLSLGLAPTGTTLPGGLRPPASVWTPQITVSRCWSGQLHGFEVAVFRTDVKQGESVLVRTAFAVRRTPFALPALVPLLARTVTIDQDSTPGWIIASMNGDVRRKAILGSLLTTLTASEVLGETLVPHEASQSV